MIGKDTGIYKIIIDKYHYYGQSVNLYNRRKEHLSKLNRGIHATSKLQNVYNKYEDFKFEKVLTCERGELDYWEKKLIDLNDERCMNLKSGGTKGYVHSAETRKKLSAASSGKNNANYGKRGADSTSFGKKATPETKAKMSAAKKGKKLSKYFSFRTTT